MVEKIKVRMMPLFHFNIQGRRITTSAYSWLNI